MAWEQVAQAQVSNAGVQGDVWKTLDELPVGTDGLLSFHAPGIGLLMDAAGAELIAKTAFWARGVNITVVDCYGVGRDYGYIRFTGSPVALLAILGAVAAVLVALSEALFWLGVVIVLVVVALFIWKVLGGVLGVFQKIASNPWTLALVVGGVLGGLYIVGRRK